MDKRGYRWHEQTKVGFNFSSSVGFFPYFSRTFIVETDASSFEISVVLGQGKQSLAFLGRTLGPRWQQLLVYDKELLVVVHAA